MSKNIFWIKKKFSRRQLIKGTLNGLPIALGLPVFDQFLNNNGTAFADGAPLPTRFGTFFWGVGYGSSPTNKSEFFPTGSGGANLNLSPTMAALEPYKNYLTVFGNYSYADLPGGGHIPQRGLSLSASHNTDWDTNNAPFGFRKQNMPLPSIDTYIADDYLNKYLMPSKQICLSNKLGGLYSGFHSWRAGGANNLFSFTPLELFNRLFLPNKQDSGPPPEGIDKVNLDFKLSILDNLKGQLASYKNSLGAQDQLRLDSHLEQVRELEANIKRLSQGTPLGLQQCLLPVNAPRNFSNNEFRLKSSAYSQLIAYALKCNLAPVFCFEFSPTQCSGTLPEIDILDKIHDPISHNAARNPEMKIYTRFVMENFAQLLKELSSISEGDKTLLDNTLVVATSEYANPGGHKNNSHPYIFAGKASGRLKGNYYAKLASEENNDASKILLSAVRAVGINAASFGMESRPITGEKADALQRHGIRDTENFKATEAVTEIFT